MQRSSIAIALCVGFGMACGLLGAWLFAPDRAPDTQVTEHLDRPAVQKTVRRLPTAPPSPQPTPEVDESSIHQARRAAIQKHWGRPPERQAAPLDERTVRDWVAAHTDGRITAVDCFVQPCVAVVVTDLPDPEIVPSPVPPLVTALEEHHPHAEVYQSSFGTRGEKRGRITVAFTSEPVARNSPEQLFTLRLTRAVVHRTSVEEFDRLKALASEEGE